MRSPCLRRRRSRCNHSRRHPGQECRSFTVAEGDEGLAKDSGLQEKGEERQSRSATRARMRHAKCAAYR